MMGMKPQCRPKMTNTRHAAPAIAPATTGLKPRTPKSPWASAELRPVATGPMISNTAGIGIATQIIGVRKVRTELCVTLLTAASSFESAWAARMIGMTVEA